jgi:hypothetical protein
MVKFQSFFTPFQLSFEFFPSNQESGEKSLGFPPSFQLKIHGKQTRFFTENSAEKFEFSNQCRTKVPPCPNLLSPYGKASDQHPTSASPCSSQSIQSIVHTTQCSRNRHSGDLFQPQPQQSMYTDMVTHSSAESTGRHSVRLKLFELHLIATVRHSNIGTVHTPAWTSLLHLTSFFHLSTFCCHALNNSAISSGYLLTFNHFC